jgi:17 kDa outer membrane surface antigen
MTINRSRLVAALLGALPLVGTSLPAAADSPWQGGPDHAQYAFPGRGVAPIPADAPWQGQGGWGQGGPGQGGSGQGGPGQGGPGQGGPDRWYHGGPGRGMVPIQRGPRVVVVPAPRIRQYRDVVVVRPYGHLYPGYGRFQADDDAYKWLAFTAITLKALDVLNEAQERAHEAAQVQATSAPIGESIHWQDGGASGSVTAVREGTSTLGRYCREFQQNVTVGGQTEQAYGTACQQPDGAWEIVSTGD